MLTTSILILAMAALPPSVDSLEVNPAEVRLVGSDGLAQIVATGRGNDGRPIDLTDSVRYEVEDLRVARVGPDGLIHPEGDGKTRVLVRRGDSGSSATSAASVVVEVADFANLRPIRFAGEVVPILSKLGCNNGGCHGKASGQNGFRLSLLGFDAKFDYDALVLEARGRRVFPSAPATSLLLAKATGKVPHGGGRKLTVGSPEYNTILRWIAQGTPFEVGPQPSLTRISIFPERRLLSHGESQQLRVSAHYDDGRVADVTRLARFQSNAEDLATVDENGRIVAGKGVGEAAVMVRFGGQVTVARATVPLGEETPSWEAPSSTNLIDPFVFGKLRELGIPPSETCTDAEFVRRATLDVCGVLPTPEDVIAFEKDADPDKRARFIDRLLDRPDYADNFAMKWSSILRNKRFDFFGRQNIDPGTFAFHRWIRESIAEDKPYDRFAAEIVAARGEPGSNPPVVWFRPGNRTKEDQVDDTAQLFLGLRIQCARCHHHPFEKWSQDDYYGFASFFARIGRKAASSDPFSAKVYVLPAGMAQHPSNGKSYPPKALDGPELSKLGPRDDPRQALAEWLRKPENPYFARAVVNRYWKHFFGRGLVEPEDDMRVSNPPTNPELLDALAADFIANGYHLKRLVRIIATSRAYDRSSLPNAWNAAEHRNFARYYARRLPAEVLLDAIDGVAGAHEDFKGLPKGFRAGQLPDNGFDSAFLEVFGRPKRESVCECERKAEANLTQSLHLLNSDEMQKKLTGKESRAQRWAEDKRPDSEKIDELYRLCYARPATAEERDVCLAHLARRRAEKQIRQGYEDLVWTLVNTKEFLFNR